MKIELFMQKTSNLFTENRLLRFILIGLVIYEGISYFTLREALNHTKTHIITQCNSEIWFTGEEVSDKYLDDIATYIVGLLGTTTVDTIERNTAKVRALVHPKNIKSVAEKLGKWRTLVKNNPRHSYFLSTPTVSKKGSNSIIVRGVQIRLLSGQVMERANVSYEISYKIENGRFWITEIGKEKL